MSLLWVRLDRCQWMWLPLREASPDASESAALGWCRESEQCLSQRVVVGASGRPQCRIALVGEHGEPFPAVSRVDLAANHAVALEAGDEMGCTGGTEQDPLGER